MRMDKDEIKSEILRRRDEYKVKKVRFRRTVGISAASGVATLALVFMLVTSPTVKKMMGKTNDRDAAASGAQQEYAFENAQDNLDGAPAAENIGTVSPGTTDGTGGETDNYGAPGPWICGTPELAGEALSPDGLLDVGTTCGAAGPSLMRTTVAFAGEEVTRFTFDGEDGRSILDLIQNTLRNAGLAEAPVEPENTDCEFVAYFEFIDADGNLSHARVGFTAEGYVLFNDEFLAPALAQNELHELQTSIEAICAYER